MWNGNIVVDAVAHAYDFTAENRVEECAVEVYDAVASYTHTEVHAIAESTAPGFQLSYGEYTSLWPADEVASVFFEESDVDVIAYHGVTLPPVSRRGISPFEIGVELKRAHPDRVRLYAPVDGLGGPEQLEEMERMAGEVQVDGFKFYPSNGLIDPNEHKAVTVSFSDLDVIGPFFEKARELGIPHIAIHKAIPIGPGPMGPSHVDDIGVAATAFPDLTFEVVHSGWAFLEDCALQMITHPNIYANLECVANFLVRRPRRFAFVLGTLMHYAGHERILFGTGAMACHPAPVLRAFEAFEMPAELVEGEGFEPLTDEVKAAILGGNYLRLHGLDAAELTRALEADPVDPGPFDEDGLPPEPWRAHRVAAAVGARA
jgi:hypothetical protein